MVIPFANIQIFQSTCIHKFLWLNFLDTFKQMNKFDKYFIRWEICRIYFYIPKLAQYCKYQYNAYLCINACRHLFLLSPRMQWSSRMKNDRIRISLFGAIDAFSFLNKCVYDTPSLYQKYLFCVITFYAIFY